MATLKRYNEWRDRLIKLIDKTVEATKFSSPAIAALYNSLSSQLREDTCNVVVIGLCLNGKSSFLNALIGEEIYPVDNLPYTAIPKELKYGFEKKALVSFYTPLPTGMLDEISVEIAAYLRANNLGKDKNGKDVPIPPLNVPYDQLNKYVTILEPPDKVMYDLDEYMNFHEKVVFENPFSVANLFYPAELLKDGVQLIDTPALDEHPTRTQVTLDYLKKADAVIFLMSATHPATVTEQEIINNVLLPLGFRDLIMVVNKIDVVRDRERFRAYVEAHMRSYTTLPHCFGVSAIEFLDGKKKGNDFKINNSGIPRFKDYLIDFLTRKKGNLKIKKSAVQIINSIENDFLNSFIPTQLAALKANATAVQQCVSNVTSKFMAVEAARTEFERIVASEQNRINAQTDLIIQLKHSLTGIKQDMEELVKEIEKEI